MAILLATSGETLVDRLHQAKLPSWNRYEPVKTHTSTAVPTNYGLLSERAA